MKTTITRNDIDSTKQADKTVLAPRLLNAEGRADFLQQQRTTKQLMPKHTAKQKVEICDRITQRIITQLEEGTVPWNKPWASYGLAKNFVTDHTYTGINLIMLNLIAPYEIPYYLTWKQIKDQGGTVIKGSKAEYVYFYKSYYKDENGKNISDAKAKALAEAGQEVQPIRFLRAFKVFNITCTDGIEWEQPTLATKENDPLTECETLLNSIEPRPKFERVNSDRAFYRPHDDIINLPNINQFSQSEAFYNTTFHEVAHWSGHESRLARKGITERVKPKSEAYAEEELIAELSASYLCGLTGIDRSSIIENNAAYLQHWISALKGDSNLILRVAPKVQAVVNFLTKHY